MTDTIETHPSARQARTVTGANPRIPYVMAHRRPPMKGPGGKPLIIHLVVNVEYWPFDKAMPRKLLTAPHGVEKIPDVPNFCWADYGMRVGMSRILNLFRERRLAASASINASVIDHYPGCAEEILELGWEFIGHGMHQSSMQATKGEREIIEQTLEKLSRFSGQRIRGWLSPGLRESQDTPDLLAESNIDYLCDWGVDDLPCWMETKPRKLIAMPYNLEINDSVIYAIEKHRSDEMFRRLQSTIECFEKETAGEAPRVLGIGLHPHLIGVAHRFTYLERMIDLLMARDDVCFMNGSQIADWFVKETSQ